MRAVVCFLLLCGPVFASGVIQVPAAPPAKSAAKKFHDGHNGVRFTVPPGWSLTKKDHQVSTFRADAANATSRNEMRAVTNMEFNPFPQSTLSGALVYYSVQRHSSDNDCQRQAIMTEKKVRPEVQNIGGLNFVHEHRESGAMCLESRDDVYLAYRKGSCYRFDLVVHLFCSKSSGAEDVTLQQMNELESRMAAILSSISFDWNKGGQTNVPAPTIEPDESFSNDSDRTSNNARTSKL